MSYRRNKISTVFIIVIIAVLGLDYCLAMPGEGRSIFFRPAGDSLLGADSVESREDYINRLSDYVKKNGSTLYFTLDSLKKGKYGADTLCDVCFSRESEMTLAERNKKLYDDVSDYLSKRRFTKFLNRILLRAERDTTQHDKVVDERLLFIPFTGYTIANIEIEPSNIFTRPKSVAQKLMMSTHVRTRRMAIRQDLMFRQGDTLNPSLIVNNLQLLRSRPAFYHVEFTIEPTYEGSEEVNVRIDTRDKWTVGFGGRADSKGRAYGEISDANFLGFGNKLKYRLSMDWQKMQYHGSLFSYDIPNLFGTFYETEMDIGNSFEHRIAHMQTSKRILVPDDYGMGMRFTAEQLEFAFIKANASDTIRYREIDLWAGFSRQLPKSELNVFSMLRYYNVRHFKRNRITLNDIPLVVDAFNNPYLHNRQILLASVGIYYEKPLTVSLVYQYGVKEYIPMGINAELLMGYMEGEYHSGPYIGASFKRGGFTNIGYMMQKISYGTFFSELTRKAYQSALNIEMDYFTNLIPLGKFKMRHFSSINYTNGWNRTDGSNEVLVFTAQTGPRALREHLIGKKRLTWNNETVLFTPWAPAGFRMALYGYIDMGLIGSHNNIFKNDFYATLGVGMRVRNERLIFRTLQIRLGIGFGKIGLLKNDWFRINTSSRMESITYRPEPPQIVPYE